MPERYLWKADCLYVQDEGREEERIPLLFRDAAQEIELRIVAGGPPTRVDRVAWAVLHGAGRHTGEAAPELFRKLKGAVIRHLPMGKEWELSEEEIEQFFIVARDNDDPLVIRNRWLQRVLPEGVWEAI